VLEQRDDLSRRYRWDALGRLTAVEQGEHTTAVSVDALGELASIDGTPLMWDSADPLTPLTWMGEQAVVGLGSPWATAGAGATQWLAPDWQGSVGDAPRDPWGAPALATGPQLGFRGEVELGGDIWLRNRVYQPGTRSFLQPDPLDNLPGAPGAANPYHYAGNDPIGAADPLGLHPVSDAELQKYRDQMNKTIWDKAGDFVSDNWEYIAAGALVVAGGALTITGVGGPAGIALMSAGISVGMQKATTGHVDLLHVGIDVAIGLGTAGLGAVAGPAIRTAGGALVRAVPGPLRSAAVRAAAALNPRQLASRLMNTGTTRAVGGSVGGASRTVAARLPQDVAVSPVAPRALPLNRPIGNSATQNAHLQQRIVNLQNAGATDLRVNQQQVNLLGERVGVNRPDLQYTQAGRRVYEEFDVPPPVRAADHEARIRANDPSGVVNLFTVP
jgi:RHS repeat-associated protein